MATVILPGPIVQLFPGSQRRTEVDGTCVREVILALDARWPGMGDRLCDSRPKLRQHIMVFVDSERADLQTPVGPGSTVEIIPAMSGG